MSPRQDTSERIDQPLKNASSDRLACLLRHWAWADEAMAIHASRLSPLPAASSIWCDITPIRLPVWVALRRRMRLKM
jgi:hypothetical protein